MKKLIYLFTLMCVILITTVSCDNEILNQDPLDQLSEEAVWDDPALVEAYVNDIYIGMGHGLYEIMFSSVTDETHFTHGYGVPQIVESNQSASDRGVFGDWRYDQWDWGDLYFRIRQANTVLEKVEQSNIADQDLIDSYKGQAHFLRAYFYHNLLRVYGGVPIVTEPAGLEDELLVARSSFAETVDFIVSEAEKAAELLPTEQTGDDLGRASGGAALALKSRVLLFAASDLFHDNPSGMPETGYTGGVDQQQMWRDAKNAAQDVMDLGIYSLYQPNPANAEEASQNYYELFLTGNTSEAIMERFFIENRDDGYNPGLHNGPNGYHNWAGNTPVQNLVDDYQTEDGSEFDWNNPDHAEAPYEERDPRLEASILHDGSQWRQRASDAVGYDQDNVIQTFTSLEVPGSDEPVPGIDTREGPIEDWNGSYTGYYLKKFIRDDVAHGSSTKQEVPWKFFRYAEVLLNYAEASIELGEEGDARRELNKIRERAGMPTFDGTVSGQALMEEYRNERRVEMAFEEQRYFDVRRWMIAPEVLDEDAMGIEISAEATDRSDRSTYSNYSYEVQPIGPGARAWDDKSYFQPIPFEEINRNDQLTQNPGY